MRKLLFVSLALLVATAPAWAAIVAGPVQTIPATYNTRLGRPSVSDYRVIAAGAPAGGVQAQLFTLATNSLLAIGSGTLADNPPLDWSVNPAGFGQNDKVGIAGSWVASEGGRDTKSDSNLSWYFNGVTPIRFGDPGGIGVAATEQNFFDVDANGKAIYVRWGIPGKSSSINQIMYQDLLNNPGGSPTMILTNEAGPNFNAEVNTSVCANLADDGSGRFTWSSNTGTKQHYIFDLNTMTNYTVYTGGAGVGNAVRSRISDDGNWIVWNERTTATQGTTNQSDIILQNVSNPALPGAAINLTNDVAFLREDPNIDITGPDTAIIVWGQRLSAQVAGNYEIYAAEVTGLLTVPVMGAPVLIASEAGVADLRYPDIDKNMIVWARNPEAAGAVTQYVLIPEPATLALLGLGVLALARRR